jgi:hypothetical protein
MNDSYGVAELSGIQIMSLRGFPEHHRSHRSGRPAKVQSASMQLRNSRNLIFDSGSIPDAVAAEAASYDL